ncbi:MAG TPA: hypothetical protein VN674_03095 [Gemmatimonadales bacterium]|nr:hypothetical protein [Gemmatimonadales bacterium]
MRRPLVPILFLAFGFAACHRPAEVSRHTIAQSLKGVLVYPRSTVVGMSSGDSAGQLSLSSRADPDSVAQWFRASLTLNHWTLQSDARQPDGSIIMYAERQSQPLWITIRQATGTVGTNYTVTGAIEGSADSAAATAVPVPDSTQRSGSNMSSKRIQRR